MARLIECIPNVSEGRRDDVVAAIAAAAVKAAPGVLLLDRTSDPDHNRSVLTFLGDGEPLVAAMTALVEAVARGDRPQDAQGRAPAPRRRRRHPVRPGPGRDERRLRRAREGRSERRSPSASAFPSTSTRTRPPRRSGRTSRRSARGSSRASRRRWRTPRGSPTSGRPRRTRRGGAIVVGARAPLIAYNINLGTADLAVADRIAKAIRHLSGGYRFVKAMGVKLEARGQVQVSINMTNFEKTPLHRVFETVRSEAERHGVAGRRVRDRRARPAGRAPRGGRPLPAARGRSRARRSSRTSSSRGSREADRRRAVLAACLAAVARRRPARVRAAAPHGRDARRRRVARRVGEGHRRRLRDDAGAARGRGPRASRARPATRWRSRGP